MPAAELAAAGVRVEILDGMVVVNHPGFYGHGLLTDRIGELLKARISSGLAVNWAGVGVYERDEPGATYQVPDIVVSRRPTGERLIGAVVEVVVEVVSPANRRLADYEHAVIAREGRPGRGVNPHRPS